jgi:hypothetical protein
VDSGKIIRMLNRTDILLTVLVFAFSACKKPAEYPDTPVISFKSIYTQKDASGFDTQLNVVLDFTDGDGDVGYNDVGLNDGIFDDPNSQYYFNYQVKTYHYDNGVLINDTVDLSARMQNVTPDVQNKALKGEINRDLPLPPNMANDTFHFEIFIYDRALHASNIVTTPDVILKTH